MSDFPEGFLSTGIIEFGLALILQSFPGAVQVEKEWPPVRWVVGATKEEVVMIIRSRLPDHRTVHEFSLKYTDHMFWVKFSTKNISEKIDNAVQYVLSKFPNAKYCDQPEWGTRTIHVFDMPIENFCSQSMWEEDLVPDEFCIGAGKEPRVISCTSCSRAEQEHGDALHGVQEGVSTIKIN